ncbi:PHB depolymerase family esterase [Streptomyces sp. DSM 42041]|uniref:PHB depolymerase family esterase n=1 Tax=Streptomyces hazeniae TaxID=3075538 RepID=A0ABU2P005_9ACTN|nr:PHB depolymerase family esterase [Streptomyces sp. DSM 42041]MDT0382102.1 PHB depolymerase family esterase [Streptomyces sp. DSM 42041]
MRPDHATPPPPAHRRRAGRDRPHRLWAAALVAALAAVATVAVSLAAPAPARAAGLEEVTGFGSNPGSLRMFRYVPDGLPHDRPLVVALHGCTQSAAEYDDETGWTELADRHGFAVLLPEQRSLNNGNMCFNWFQNTDTSRGSGEALSVVQMMDRMRADTGVDPGRSYVTGLSAGGAMTAVMMAAYPDRFDGGAVVAGIPYRCASSVVDAFGCMNPGSDRSAAQWGDAVRGASSHTGPWPTLSVWHGTSDTTVAPVNQRELVEQWTHVHGTDATADASDTVAGYPHRVHRDAGGEPVVEEYEITGMGHGQPVDPGSGAGQCGRAAPYVLDVGICAAHHIAQFWGIGGGDPGPGPDPEPGDGTAVLGSDDARDGYVKAAADGSSATVGTLEGTLGLAVGRGVDGRHSRTVLSFDTSALPDGATVTGAHLTVARTSGSGDPWADPAGNTLVADVHGGCLGGSCTVAADDWSAPADAPAAARVPRPASGTAESGTFDAAGLAAIDPAGTTQVRLRFAQAPAGTAYVFLGAADRATLTVTYRT